MSLFPAIAFGMASDNAPSTSPGDTITLDINFRQGRYELDYGDNLRRMAEFVSAVDSVYQSYPFLYQIVIHSSASPEGRVHSNYILSKNRGNALRKYLESHLKAAPDTIIVVPHGEDWSGLKDIVTGLDTSWRDDALSILNSASDTLTMKRRLKSLNRGSVWTWLLKYKYPQLRRATNALCLPVREPLRPVPLPAYAPPLQHPFTPLVEHSFPEKPRGLALAVKTNLLSDAVLAPNIEVEWPLDEKWSMAVDWTFPWWLFRGNSYCEELLGGTFQARRYFGHRKTLGYFTGWFAEAYAGLGYYDFQIPSKGAQGEYAHTGIGGGYSLRLGEYFNLEFEIALGFLLTQYRRYTPLENNTILLYRETVWSTWTGPTRAKVSLVWRLGKKCRSNNAR
ncbi:MAG: DUF3575 domain-containing protein [Bacteroidales bacterium]|nr:DUF3575 domain-containing protein [Bacteroidales bacterium]